MSCFLRRLRIAVPGMNSSFPCLNEDTVTGPVVEINSLYRFSEIFQDLLHNMGGF